MTAIGWDRPKTVNPLSRLTAFYLLAYALRLGLVLGILLASFVLFFKPRFGLDNLAFINRIISALDIFRSLSYLMLPIAALLLFLPGSCCRRLAPRRLSALALAAGSLSAALVLIAPCITRSSFPIEPIVLLSALYVGLNVAVFCRLHAANNSSLRDRRLLFRIAPLLDLLLPPAVWSAYNRRCAGLLALARPFPTLIVCGSTLVPYMFLANLAQNAPPDRSAIVQRVLLPAGESDNLYQVSVDQSDGALLLTAYYDDAILRVDPVHPAAFKKLAIPGLGDQMRSGAIDQDNGALVFVAPAAGTVYCLDARTLRIRRLLRLERSYEQMQYCDTIADPRIDIFAVVCLCNTLVFTPGSFPAAALYHTDINIGKAVDGARGEVHLINWEPSALLAINARAQRIERALSLPAMSGGLGVYPADDRGFVPNPMSGTLLEIDLRKYSVTRSVYAFPGVRIVEVDPQRGLIFLAGFAPLLEVRSLKDLSLLARIAVPGYVTSMDIDPARSALYLAANQTGVWRVDLDALSRREQWAALYRLDPFYLFCGSVNHAIMSMID